MRCTKLRVADRLKTATYLMGLDGKQVRGPAPNGGPTRTFVGVVEYPTSLSLVLKKDPGWIRVRYACPLLYVPNRVLSVGEFGS